MRVWWGRYAEAELQGVIDGIRARGEPLEWHEFAGPPVAPDQDATPLYREAWRSLQALDREFDGTLLGPRGLLSDLLTYPQFRHQRAADLRRIVQRSQPIVMLCRQARDRPACTWGCTFTDHEAEQYPRMLRLCVPLTRLLCLNAVARSEEARHGDAIECLRDALRLADAAYAYPASIPSMTARRLEGIITVSVEQTAPRLGVGPAPAASREQFRQLIAALLDETARRRGRVRASQEHRTNAYLMVRSARQKTQAERTQDGLPGRLGAFILQPMIALDVARVLRMQSAHVAYAGGSNKDDSRDAFRKHWPRGIPEDPDRWEDSMGSVGRVAYALSRLLVHDFGDVHVLDRRILGGRRMAATALATRLYQLDHGTRPETLGDLVPGYLAQLPRDPEAEGDPIRYLPVAEEPRLYCVNDNETDDGGMYWHADAQPGAEKHYSPAAPDLAFFLDGMRPRASRSEPEPVEHDRRGPPRFEFLMPTTRSSTATSTAPTAPR